jgi:ankyrin repeat protein
METPLHLASENWHSEVARMLIEKGANINATGMFFYQFVWSTLGLSQHRSGHGNSTASRIKE